MVRLIAVLAGLYVVYGAVMTVIHPRLIYPFVAEPFAREGYVRVWLDTPDGRLSLQVRDGEPGKPAILIFMGNAGNLQLHVAILQKYEPLGFTVVGVEYPGGGGVPGTPSEQRLKRDALAAFDWTAARGRPVIVLGYSLGSGLAVHVAAEREAAALMLDAPYAWLCEIMTAHSWLPACYMPFVQKWPSYREGLRVTEPVLIRHGTADELVPFAQGLELAPAFGDHVTFVPIEGKGHGNLHEGREFAPARQAFLGALGLEN